MNSKKVSKVCSAPWVALAINANKSFSLCCNTLLDINLGNWNDSSILEVFKSSSLSRYRKSFLSGVKENACKGCYALEESHLLSKRDDFNKYYKFDPTQKVFSYSDIKRLELFLSNRCNFNCRTCGSFLSSSWNKDSLELKRDVYNHSPPTEKQMEELFEVAKHLHSIYIAGGEPLICKETYLLLDSLLKFNNECEVTINTNLSALRFQEFNLLNYIPSLPSLSLNVSIDGIYDKGEYIRNGQNFKIFEENLSSLAKTDIKISFLITISILNVFDVAEIIHYIVEKQPVRNYTVDINFVHDPSLYNIQILPDNIKSMIQASLYLDVMNFNNSSNLKKYSQKLISICSFLKNDNTQSNIDEFFEETRRIDTLRSQSFHKVFPELASTLSYPNVERPV
ncbi:twitch domain-containing radical SAM protein [Halobacteriovorax sp. JY17]|uniref:twitch domain-containing radical SAM protein n=1 Tax=Halobacteriovorax sp. JY17 TaxID=2014617 RepID=UPI000C44B423|nr:twitch domain-containing radical SAM protein [Halobacteriovorax sp. JY17]PIK14271.1 MAG: hypothetical protein CES88_14950 [Halobacteriovorax sp. JY17]